ncbi:YcaO-like family protein [Nonomuraea sp. NPDC049309]|uniref:YcaO-like family protein n=1 Tax=Nonomuraea sp. NPDC049309 TaxID=3364350 RepID=UPI00371AA59F
MIDFKPRLPADVRFAPTSGGVAFLTREGIVRMNGASAHLWMERLATYLDGSRTVAELTAGLPDERRAFVTGLLTKLHERGLVEDAARAGGRARPGALDLPAGLRCSLLGGGDRFGALPAALADALTRLGLEVVRTAGDAVDRAGTCDAMVHLASAGADGLAAAAELDRLSAAHGVPVMHVLLREGEAWWSEAGIAGGEVPPLAAGWRRLAAMEARPPEAGPVRVPSVAAAVVAGQVAADLGRRLSGTPRADGDPRLHVVDLAELHTRTHTFLPHPAVARPDGSTQAAPQREKLTEEEFSRRAARLMDSRTGVFAEIDEGEYGQLPLHVSVTTVADPMGVLGGARPRVIGVGHDFAVARYRAALKALAVHGLLACDPRRLLTADGEPLFGAPAAPDGSTPPLPEAAGQDASLLEDVAAGRAEAFVRGRDLVNGDEVLLPAREVFLDPYAIGAAAGYSAEEALVAALLEHVAATGRDGPLPPVDAAGARSADTEIDRSLALLEATGRDHQVLDATGACGVPVFAGTLDGRLVARAAGVTPLAALRATLEGMLAAYQGIPASRPLPDVHLTAADRSPVTVDAHAEPLSAAHLAAALAGEGLRAGAVPLDHDAAVHALVPHVVRVVTYPLQEPLHG